MCFFDILCVKLTVFFVLQSIWESSSFFSQTYFVFLSYSFFISLKTIRNTAKINFVVATTAVAVMCVCSIDHGYGWAQWKFYKSSDHESNLTHYRLQNTFWIYDQPFVSQVLRRLLSFALTSSNKWCCPMKGFSLFHVEMETTGRRHCWIHQFTKT